MNGYFLVPEQLKQFQERLYHEEKSAVTIEKYIRDVIKFSQFASEKEISKEVVVQYKKYLQEKNYAIRSINSMLTSVNQFFEFLGWTDCKVKILRSQRQIYCPEDKELTKAECLRLLEASRPYPQLNHIIQTICSTGIRISELKYFTVEAIHNSEVSVTCKNKTRIILIPGKLRKLLLDFAKKIRSKAVSSFGQNQGNQWIAAISGPK